MEQDWFDSWSIISAGIGGDYRALACPKHNDKKPNRTPDCIIDINHSNTIAELRTLAAIHRKKFHTK